MACFSAFPRRQLPTNPCWIAPEIEHCIDADDRFFDEIVNSEREPLREGAMESELHRMDACEKDQRIEHQHPERLRSSRPRRARVGRKTRARPAGRPRPRRGPEFSLAFAQQAFFHFRPLAKFSLTFRDTLRAGCEHFPVPGWRGHTFGGTAQIIPKFLHYTELGSPAHLTQGQNGCGTHEERLAS